MIKCRCILGPDCRVHIRFDVEERQLLFTDGQGNEAVMYLDANAVSELMAEMRIMLAAMVEGRTKQEAT